MFICYLDESGVPEQDAGTSHFVLLGLAIPAESWREHDSAISLLKQVHRLGTAELHAGWMARRFPEQERIVGFDAMSETERKAAVVRERHTDMNRAAARSRKAATDLAKTHRKTADYIHLNYVERRAFISAVADAIGGWSECVLFADAQMKSASRPNTKSEEIFDFAFEQVVTRFNTFLGKTEGKQFGLVVQDRNETAATRLTYLMRRFHSRGTSWSFQVSRIVETPLFVDSELTSMVQLADVCSYATRRFLENGETDLFDRIYPSFHRSGGKLVGLRHYTGKNACSCRICQDHGRPMAAQE